MGAECGFSVREGKRTVGDSLKCGQWQAQRRRALPPIAGWAIVAHSRPMPVTPTIAGDRLYGISMRPQELAIYGEAVSFSLRYGPVVEDPSAELTQHFKLLVLEIHADLKQDDALAHGRPRKLQLLKCGWEIELVTLNACRTDSLTERDDEAPLLLGRIADTVNELARRAGLEAPLGPDLIVDLLQRYRAGLASPANGLQ
jgi:hypothetical protein